MPVIPETERKIHVNEWVLILTLNLLTFPGEMRDISPIVVSGFRSQQNCDKAAAAITNRILVLLGKAREQQGIKPGENKGLPAIWYECVNIAK